MIATVANSAAEIPRWVARPMFSAMAAAPINPPRMAPAAQTACNELMMDRP